MSLKNKLNRLKPHLSIGSQTENNCDNPERAAIDIPYLEKWKKEQVVPYYLDQNYCLIREVKYPLTHQHGRYHFQDFLTAIDNWNQHPINHPLSAEGHRAEDLFFFDTETTGLGGGVGNTIFLLGYASVSGDQLILRQHILPHPGAEVPLYQSFLEKVNYRTLVTYNGKSFDWPQVKTRHTLVRENVPRLPEFGHFDLFHAARRLWKHKLDRMKLSIVEKEVLGVDRVDDIPGFLAPMIYFDFIERKQPEGMLGIIKHNEIDILSLVSLYTHLTFQLYGTDQDQTRPETFEVGRWFSSLGEKKEATMRLTKLTNNNDITSYKAKLILAYQHKKEQNWVQARDLFLDAAESGELGMMVEANLELAKIYEHKLKDYHLAINSCNRAITLLAHPNNKVKMKKHLSQELFQTRLIRLKQKYAKCSK